MSALDQLDSDIHAFFNEIEKMTPEGKKKSLKILIDKYAHLMSTPCILDKHDFDMIKDHAHKFFVNSAFPKKIGSNRREVSSYEANILSVIEGTISVLNSRDCLKKLAKFDYRD